MPPFFFRVAAQVFSGNLVELKLGHGSAHSSDVFEELLSLGLGCKGATPHLDLSHTQPLRETLAPLLALVKKGIYPASFALEGDDKRPPGGLGDLGVQALVQRLTEAEQSRGAKGPLLRRLDLSYNVPHSGAPMDVSRLDDGALLPLFQAASAAADEHAAAAVFEHARWPIPAGGLYVRRMRTVWQLTQLLPSAMGLETLSLRGNPGVGGFGPDLGALFRFGLTATHSLTELDVSGNALGDLGIGALGQALRKNRSLTSLKMDRNGVGIDGLQELKLALNGNKKLIDLPLPDADIDAQLQGLLGPL